MKTLIDDIKMQAGIDYAPKPKRDVLLISRETTHGDYTENARVAQEIKTILTQSQGYTKLNNRQRESLDLIATKIGRIMSGDPGFKDHWDDIAGYAKLGSEACD